MLASYRNQNSTAKGVCAGLRSFQLKLSALSVTMTTTICPCFSFRLASNRPAPYWPKPNNIKMNNDKMRGVARGTTRRCRRSKIPVLVSLLLLGVMFPPGDSYSTTTPVIVRGSAAKPYEKKKVAVFGGGGYLGACIYGFLQRAGSLYGTGIAGINAPRAITATGAGSQSLNGVLGKNFILAQADESFVKLTDMTSVESIRSRVRGFDVVVLATLYTLESRPVTGGSYEKTPNDKTLELYMDRPRSLINHPGQLRSSIL
jgi:hypothetical protein